MGWALENELWTWKGRNQAVRGGEQLKYYRVPGILKIIIRSLKFNKRVETWLGFIAKLVNVRKI